MIYRDEFVTIQSQKTYVIIVWHADVHMHTVVFHPDTMDTEELRFEVANPNPDNPRRVPMHVGYN